MSLSNEDIAIIKGMLARGDKQSDIAAWYGMNNGRVVEINRCDEPDYAHVSLSKKARKIKSAANGSLPPPGPYVVVAEAHLSRLNLPKDTLHVRRLRGDDDETD